MGLRRKKDDRDIPDDTVTAELPDDDAVEGESWAGTDDDGDDSKEPDDATATTDAPVGDAPAADEEAGSWEAVEADTPQPSDADEATLEPVEGAGWEAVDDDPENEGAGDQEGDEDDSERQKELIAQEVQRNRRRLQLLNAFTYGTFALVLVLVLLEVEILVQASLAAKAGVAAVASVLAMASSHTFSRIDWQILRRAEGSAITKRSRSELQLTIARLVMTIMVSVLGVLELGALLVFVEFVELEEGFALFIAQQFLLVHAAALLVYVLVVVARIYNGTNFHPSPGELIVSKSLGYIAPVWVPVGVLLALGVPQSYGYMATVDPHQGIFLITLGVILDLMAASARLRLPTIRFLFRDAVRRSQRATPELKQAINQRAVRTYVIAILFVAGSMAFAGAVLTGSVDTSSSQSMRLALLIFYVGLSLITLGVLALRVYQSRNVASKKRKRKKKDGKTRLEDLVNQKRRGKEETIRIAVYSVGGLLSAIFLMMALFAFQERIGDKKFFTDYLILSLLFAFGPYGFYYNREARRVEAMEQKFPDFLRDIAESARAGMTLPKALAIAGKGTYGALTPEIKRMAAQVEWGVDFTEVMDRFAKRTKTPLIERTVALVTEAQRAGGNMVDILTAASEDAREIKQIISERNQQMSMYSVVIYIAFFVFIAVVLILTAQFIPAFKEAVGAASGQQVGGLQFQDFDVEEFNTMFFHAALVQAVGGGLVGGVLTRGQPWAGLMNIIVMVLVAWASFRIVVGLL